MLFDPDDRAAASRSPCWRRVLIIVIGKSVAAFVIVRLFRHPHADRADDLGEPRADRRVLVHPRRSRRQSLALLPERGRDLDPGRRDPVDPAQSAVLRWLDRILAQPDAPRAGGGCDRTAPSRGAGADPADGAHDHVVLVGYGRVGSYVAAEADGAGTPLLVIESDADCAGAAERRGREAITGNAADPDVLRGGQPAGGALPAGGDAGCVRGRPGGRAGAQAQPELPIIARAHSEDEIEHLQETRRDRGGDGRARDRQGDDRRHPAAR